MLTHLYIQVQGLYLANINDCVDSLHLMKVIGRGTYGIVHQAIWRGSIVAAKVMPIPAPGHPEVTKEIEICRYIIIIWLR